MHTGDQPPFAGGSAQQTFPCMPGLVRIDVKGHRHLWPGALDRGKWTISPRLAATFARLEAISGMAAAYGRAGDMVGSPAIRLVFINITNLRRADRHYAADEQHVASATIAGVVQCRWRQPVSAFPRGQEHRGVGISRCTGGGQQPADMVRCAWVRRMVSILRGGRRAAPDWR